MYYKDISKLFYRYLFVVLDENGYNIFDSTPTTFVVNSNLDTHDYH
jgi:hypothetical protein